MSYYEFKLIDKNSNTGLVPAAQALLRATNNPKEVDEDDTVIEGFENSEIPYFAFGAVDANGDMAHVSFAGVVGTALALTYSSTRVADRNRGLATEGNALIVQHGKAIANAMGKPIKLVTAETTPESRSFWESVGLKRAYLALSPSKVVQVRYVQRALDFGDDGLPTEDAGEVPLHMMYLPLGDITIAELIEATDAVADWSSLWGPDDFDTKKAYKAHVAYNNMHRDEFHAQFDGDAELMFLSEAEVEHLRSTGVRVVHFIEADEA